MRHPTIWLCLLTAAAALAAACADDTSQGCTSDADCRGERVCSEQACTELDDVAESTQDCAAGEAVEPGVFAQFIWDEETGAYAMGHSRSGSSYGAYRVHVFLEPCGDAVVFYEEGFLGHGFNPYDEYEYDDRSGHRTRIDTSWSVDAEELVVGDLLTCTLEDYHTNDSLSCTLQRAVGSDEALGGSSRLFGQDDGKTPEDEEFAEYERL